MSRRADLESAWLRCQAEVASSCQRHGRNVDDVTVIAVTKGHSIDDIALLADIGVTDIGESRDDEARMKFAALHERGLRWHCIGQVQTNKARNVATWADVVHSVDRTRLVTALARAVPDAKLLDVLIQVDATPTLTPNAQSDTTPTSVGRGGVDREHVRELAADVAREPSLRLRGVMTVAPLDGDAATAFDTVARVWSQLRGEYPLASVYSAGMSGDFDLAIAAGATHLRIGSAILGSRP